MLASAEYGMSPQMQKYMKARAVAMGEEADFGGPVGQAGHVDPKQRRLQQAYVCPGVHPWGVHNARHLHVRQRVV